MSKNTVFPLPLNYFREKLSIFTRKIRTRKQMEHRRIKGRTHVYFWTWLFQIFMNSFSPSFTSVKSSIILLVLIFSHSGSGLKHGKLKTGVCCACAHAQDFSPVDLQPFGIRTKAWWNKNTTRYVAHAQDFAPVDLQPLGIRPKAWRNKSTSKLRMRRTFLLLIFRHSGSGLKDGEIKTGVCCTCTGFFSCWSSATLNRP